MISKYVEEDLKDIIRLGNKINPKFGNLFNINNLNEKENILVYKLNNKVVGFVHYSVNYEVADLLNIIIDEDHRLSGYASQLIDFMIGSIPSETQKILLEVSEKNLQAIKLYYKFNFEIINIRPNYYEQDAALVMERILQ